jgi:hypothetical protein
MRREKDKNGRATDAPDFDAPTPRGLRRKMVRKADIMRRLRQEFRGIVMDALNEYRGFRLLDFNADNLIVHAKHGRAVERRVLGRALSLEKLAYFRNADIKFGLRDRKGRWWQESQVA